MPKPHTAPHLKRQLLVGRVYPATKKYLESLGDPNFGRAIDHLVQDHQAIVRALRPELRAELDPPAPVVVPQPKHG
jgi:hypothetical protein